MSTIIRVLVLCGFSFWLTLSSASAQMSTIEQAATVKKLKAISHSLKQMQQQIPQHYLSPEALAEKNDYEPEKIVTWIKQNIKFAPSPGYQLSPQSALRTATGNAIEQAVLLQNVLVQAGLEVRLAKATLDVDQAMTLLQESFVPSHARQWQMDPAIRDEYFKQLSLQFGSSEDNLSKSYAKLENLTPWPDSPVYKEAKTLAMDFSAAISKAQQVEPLATADLIQPWLSNAQDYYFVKYRFSQGDPWLEAHPAFSVTKPVITNSSYYTQGLETQHHQLTLQAFITREFDGKTETIPVTGLHMSTVADLFERQLKFSTVPSGMQKAIEEKTFESLESDQFFAPSINSEIAMGARFFTLDGSDYSLAEVSDPMGGIAIASNKKVNQLTDRLGGALEGKEKLTNEKTSKSRLLEYYLAITWSAPNGQKRSLRRTIYREQAGQNPTQTLNAITQTARLGVTPVSLAPAAELYASLDTLGSVFTLLAKLKSESYTDSQILKQLSDWASSTNDLVFNTAVKLSEEAAGSARLFSHGPVVALKWEQRENDATTVPLDQAASNSSAGTKTTFDYLINAAQAAVAKGEVIEIDPSRTLNYGVWSTYGEAILLSGTPQRDGLSEQSISAANAFNKSLTQKQFSVLSAANLNSTIPTDLAKRIIENPNYVFLVPTSATQTAPAAYYRVNPATGEALGYSLDGRGSSDYAIALNEIFNMVWLVGNTMRCVYSKETDGEILACAGCAILDYAISTIALASTVTNVLAANAGKGVCVLL